MSRAIPGWAEVEVSLLRRKTAASKDVWRAAHRKGLASFVPEEDERALDGVVAYLHDGFDQRRGRNGTEVTLGDLVATMHRLMYLNDELRVSFMLRDFDSVSGVECKAGLIRRDFAIRVRSGADEHVWTSLNQESGWAFGETLHNAVTASST